MVGGGATGRWTVGIEEREEKKVKKGEREFSARRPVEKNGKVRLREGKERATPSMARKSSNDGEERLCEVREGGTRKEGQGCECTWRRVG